MTHDKTGISKERVAKKIEEMMNDKETRTKLKSYSSLVAKTHSLRYDITKCEVEMKQIEHEIVEKHELNPLEYSIIHMCLDYDSDFIKMIKKKCEKESKG